MLSNKPRISRLHEIDRLIRAKQHPNAKTLAERFEVSQRTAQRDLEFLRDRMDAPLEYDRSRRGYRYTEESYALPALTLRQDELDALRVVQRFLERLGGSTLGRDLEGLGRKLEAVIERSGVCQGEGCHETLLAVPLAETKEAVYAAARRAIRERRRLRFDYERSDGERRAREIEPYDLVFWDGAWYVVGFSSLRQSTRIFALSRLSSVEITTEKFDLPASWSLEDYLDGAFALFVASKASPTERITLRFSGYAARYVAERHWHRSQHLEELDAGELRLHLELPPTPALERFILGWGDEVVVESPPALADRIRSRQRAAIEKSEGVVRSDDGEAS